MARSGPLVVGLLTRFSILRDDVTQEPTKLSLTSGSSDCGRIALSPGLGRAVHTSLGLRMGWHVFAEEPQDEEEEVVEEETRSHGGSCYDSL